MDIGRDLESLGIDPLLALLLVSAALAVLPVILIAIHLSDRSGKDIHRRVEELSQRWNAEQQAVTSLRKRNADVSIHGMGLVIKYLLPHPDKLRRRLAATGREMPLSLYLLSCVGVLTVSFLVADLIIGLQFLTSLLIGIAIGIGLPHFVVSALIRKRIAAFIGQFPEAIELIVRGLKSGLPPAESIATVGLEFPDPIGAEFRRVTDSVKFGQSMDDALDDTAQRIETPELRFFTIALAVQRETGGNLAETLENLSDILRRRRQMKLKIRAMSSEARASAIIIGSLPLIMFCLLYLVGGDYVTVLISDPRGMMMSGVGLGIQAVGAAVMAKMVRFEI